MTKEFCLSDKMLINHDPDDDDFLRVSDVKEFIRRLKETWLSIASNPKQRDDFLWFIDKLAGNKLVEEGE